jgi:hypothetical protein
VTISAIGILLFAGLGLLTWHLMDGAEPGDSALDPAKVDIRGTVTATAIFDVTSPDQDSVGALTIEGPRDPDIPFDKASVTITKDTRFYRLVGGEQTQVEGDLLRLQGAEVEATFTGPVAESYPVQATAATVTILD